MASKPMKIKAWMEEGATNIAGVKVIIFHDMESGLRKDKATGQFVPAHFITEMACEHNGKNIMTCLWGATVSKNPFLAFRVKNAKKGDTIKLSWVDNKGEKEVGESTIE